jgi:hypothetical protein
MKQGSSGPREFMRGLSSQSLPSPSATASNCGADVEVLELAFFDEHRARAGLDGDAAEVSAVNDST